MVPLQACASKVQRNLPGIVAIVVCAVVVSWGVKLSPRPGESMTNLTAVITSFSFKNRSNSAAGGNSAAVVRPSSNSHARISNASLIAKLERPKAARIESASQDVKDGRARLKRIVDDLLNGTKNECMSGSSFLVSEYPIDECYCIRDRECTWCSGEQMAIPVIFHEAIRDYEKLCVHQVFLADQCENIGCVAKYGNSPVKMMLVRTWTMWTSILLCIVALLCRSRRREAEAPKSVFCSFNRGFDDFAKHKFEGVVATPKLQTMYENSSTSIFFYGLDEARRTFSTPGSAAESAVTSFLVTIIIQASICALLRAGVLFLPFAQYRDVMSNFASIHTMVTRIGPVLPILLGFYLVNRLQHFWFMRWAGDDVSGKCSNLALTARGILQKSTLDADSLMEQKYVLYRYLTLTIVLNFSIVSPSLKAIEHSDIIKVGLMTAQESELLNTSIVGKPSACGMILEGWIADWIIKNVPESEAPWGKKRMMEELTSLRSCCSKVLKANTERALFSFEALLFSMINILTIGWALSVEPSLLTPDKRSDLLQSGIVFGGYISRALICLFYITILHMLQKMNAPFKDSEEDVDGLDFEHYVISLEKKMRDYLTGPNYPTGK